MLVTIVEASERLKLAPETVRVAIRRGTIPAVKIGRRLRIRQDVLDALEQIGSPVLTSTRKI